MEQNKRKQIAGIAATQNVYKRRDPNDKVTYIDRKALNENLEKRRRMIWENALRDDMNMWINRDPFIVRKDLYAAGQKGGIMELYPYKKPHYLDFNSNNPSLWQGGEMVMSMRNIYGKTLNDQYKQSRENLTPGNLVPTIRK